MTDPNVSPSDPERYIEGLVPDVSEMRLTDLAATTDPTILEATALLLEKTLKGNPVEVTILYPDDPDQIP